uniref:Uncharacterized protein n=1 Tax=Anguilla anguilla TaxID=7936 RepID=A0A0E9UGK3_ANGAN
MGFPAKQNNPVDLHSKAATSPHMRVSSQHFNDESLEHVSKQILKKAGG